MVSEVPLGAIVIVKNAGRGTVRFEGTTSFATGRWVGVELDEPKGKNDGTVQGVAYFSCQMHYGMFVRVTQIERIEVPPSAASASALPTPPTPSNTRSPVHRLNTSVSGLGSPPAMSRANSSTQRSVESSRAASPQKTAAAAGLTRSRLVPASAIKRSPMSPPTIGTSATGGYRVPQSPITRTSVQAQLAQLPSRRGSVAQSPAVTSAPPIPPPTFEPPPATVSTPSSIQRSPLLSEGASPLEPSESRELSLNEQDGDTTVTRPPVVSDDSRELRVKLRVLEMKREDDARKIRELEARWQEAEAFVALRPKLQAKLQQLRDENIALKGTVTDHAANISKLEKKLEEQSEELEMVMLDKEVAEERAEVAEGELEGEKEAKAELEVELEVWRKGGGTVAEGADGLEDEGTKGARTELAYRQMEKQNERLKEALMKLRDLAHEQDAEQRRRISDLEKELAGVDELQSQYEQTLSRLEHAELQVEDLKQQLDDALGAEEMLVQLTEKNLLMGERIEEMRITIEDLEALRELNDELEETHVETERQLQEDVDMKDTEIRDLEKKVEMLHEGLQDYEGTVQQFRDLVTSLQQELDTLREQDQTRQTESQAQATQSAALLSLNMRLQSSAAKNQARNIDLEIKKLDAAQARELLDIVQPYLPQTYLDSDSNPTSCYLFFQRIAYKMDLINTVMATQYGLPDSLNGSVHERMVGACDIRTHIAHLAALCKRLATLLRFAEPEAFIKAGKTYLEVAAYEKRVDMHIDLLRREEFRETECMVDVDKMVLQFENIHETWSTAEIGPDIGEHQLDLASRIDCDLDTFFATLGLVKSAISSVTGEEGVQLVLGDLDLEATLLNPLQNLADLCKGPRLTAKKLTKRVEELLAESSAVDAKVLSQWIQLSKMAEKLSEFGLNLAQPISSYVAEARGQTHSFELSAVLSIVRQSVTKAFGSGGSAWGLIEQALGAVNQEFSSLSPVVLDPESTIHVGGTYPWVARVEEIRAKTAVNMEAEREVVTLNEKIVEAYKIVRIREHQLEECEAKIEFMERKQEGFKGQSDTIADLESKVEDEKRQKEEYSEAVEHLTREAEVLEEDKARLIQQLKSAREQSSTVSQPPEGETPTIVSNYDTSQLMEHVESLRGTVRFLREENSYLKGQDLLKEIYALPDITPYTPPTPPLSPTRGISPPSSPDLDDPKPTLRSLQTESKLLYREVIQYSSSIRVVDLSKISQDGKKRKPWVPYKYTPAGQLHEQRLEGERLSRRIKSLAQRTNALSP